MLDPDIRIELNVSHIKTPSLKLSPFGSVSGGGGGDEKRERGWE